MLLCILSFIVAIFVVSEQISITQFCMKYIETYGNDPKSGDNHSKLDSSDKESNHQRVKSISILGERNSGTTWIYEHLNECFNHSIPIKRRLSRYKHWFQDENIGVPITNGTLTIAIFRNPFEWVEAMRKKPHHAPNHMFLENWKEFVTKPWTMDRVGKDLEMTEEEILKTDACQENFMYRDLISCHVRPYRKGTFNKTHYSEHQPFYEMRYDESGEPFDSILEMRAAKIRNFLSTKHFLGVTEFWMLQYEVLVNAGTLDLIEKIEAFTGTKSHCDSSPPQGHRKKRGINPDLVEYLMKNLDWEAENMVGYYKSGMKNPKGE